MLLTFPLPINLANGRHHWRTKHSLYQQWKQMAVALEPGLRQYSAGRPYHPFPKVRVSAVLYVHQRMDTGNAMARLKWVEDLVVERGWVEDDSPAHWVYDGVPSQVVDRKRPRVELTVSPEP